MDIVSRLLIMSAEGCSVPKIKDNDSFSEYLAQFHDENVDMSNINSPDIIKTLPKPFVNIKHEVDAINNVRSSNRLSKAFKNSVNVHNPENIQNNHSKNEVVFALKDTKSCLLNPNGKQKPADKTSCNKNPKMLSSRIVQSNLAPLNQNKRDNLKPVPKTSFKAPISKSNVNTLPIKSSVNKEATSKNPIPSKYLSNKPTVNNIITGAPKPLIAPKLLSMSKCNTVSNKNPIKPVTNTDNDKNLIPKDQSSVQLSVNKKLVYSTVSKNVDIKSNKEVSCTDKAVTVNFTKNITTHEIKVKSQISTTSSRLYVPSNYKDLIIQKAQDKLKKEFEKTNSTQLVSLQEKELRKLTIHKAKPMPNFKPFEIKKTVFIPTIPKSPNFTSKNPKK